MVEAQTRMNTAQLIALMVMAALVGYLVDQLLLHTSKLVIRWK